MIIRSNQWGSVSQLQVPCSVMQNNKLVLRPTALKVLLAFLLDDKKQTIPVDQRHNDNVCTVKTGTKELIKRTGRKKNNITEALKELEKKKFILSHREQREEDHRFAVNEYVLCNPVTGKSLNKKFGENLCYANGVSYFLIPRCVVADETADWSLTKLTGSEVLVYVACLLRANDNRSTEFVISASELRRLSGLSRQSTVRDAIAGLENRNLLLATPNDDGGGSELKISLCDPHTGEPPPYVEKPEDDINNYREVSDKGRESPAKFELTTEQFENLVRSCLREGAVIEYQNSGNLMVQCPFHPDNTPSCSISPVRRQYNCFGGSCHAGGSLTKFVMETKKLERGEAIKYIAAFAGKSLKYIDPYPDNNVETIYRYKNKRGFLVKQVLRHKPGSEDRFSQRRPDRRSNGYGWRYDMEDVKPLLYNRDRLEYTYTILITEGEKDADRVNSLHLCTPDGSDVLATTSGGSKSWHPSLAEDLKGRRVVVMSDADDAGQSYRDKIVDSLKALNIEYRVVNFDLAVDGKDVSEYLDNGNTVNDLVERIGGEWVTTVDRLNAIAEADKAAARARDPYIDL